MTKTAATARGVSQRRRNRVSAAIPSPTRAATAAATSHPVTGEPFPAELAGVG